MKKFLAKIDVMPHKDLLDPQGKTVANNMRHVHIDGVHDVRIGKHIEMTLEAPTEEEARAKVELSCKKLLSNPITENYRFLVMEI